MEGAVLAIKQQYNAQIVKERKERAAHQRARSENIKFMEPPSSERMPVVQVITKKKPLSSKLTPTVQTALTTAKHDINQSLQRIRAKIGGLRDTYSGNSCNFVGITTDELYHDLAEIEAMCAQL